MPLGAIGGGGLNKLVGNQICLTFFLNWCIILSLFYLALLPPPDRRIDSGVVLRRGLDELEESDAGRPRPLLRFLVLGIRGLGHLDRLGELPGGRDGGQTGVDALGWEVAEATVEQPQVRSTHRLPGSVVDIEYLEEKKETKT